MFIQDVLRITAYFFSIKIAYYITVHYRRYVDDHE